MKKIVTENSKETQKLGEMLAQEIQGGTIICLEGDLGSGKTTFTQGFLKGLKVKGPYTSPTFLIIKKYDLVTRNSQLATKKEKFQVSGFKFQDIYHIDAYRVAAEDILALGWEEMIKNKNNIIIIEWADRIKKIIPKDALWIKFKWLDPPRVDSHLLGEVSPRVEAGENKREIIFV